MLIVYLQAIINKKQNKKHHFQDEKIQIKKLNSQSKVEK